MDRRNKPAYDAYWTYEVNGNETTAKHHHVQPCVGHAYVVFGIMRSAKKRQKTADDGSMTSSPSVKGCDGGCITGGDIAAFALGHFKIFPAAFAFFIGRVR